MQQQASPSTRDDIANFEHQCWKDANPWAIALIERQIDQRAGEHASREMVIDVSLSRYFQLIETARSELAEHLSEAELVLLLNAHPHAWWCEGCEIDPARIVFESYGLDNSADRDNPARQLCEKLQALTPLQRLALIEVCECAWRDRSVGALASARQHLAPAPEDDTGTRVSR